MTDMRSAFWTKIDSFNQRFYCFNFFAGIVNSEGRLWKDQRRFLNEKLRHFGMTYLGNRKEQMETRIMVSINFRTFPIYITCVCLLLYKIVVHNTTRKIVHYYRIFTTSRLEMICQ